jgi:hypothetical protein
MGMPQMVGRSRLILRGENIPFQTALRESRLAKLDLTDILKPVPALPPKDARSDDDPIIMLHGGVADYDPRLGGLRFKSHAGA